MRLLKRPMLVLGGSAKLWGSTSNWDKLFENCVAVARAHGIPTIAGESYFSLLEQHAEGNHSQHTRKNCLLSSKFFEEAVNCVNAIVPVDSYAAHRPSKFGP